MIADALSRAPYFEASEENELYCHAIFSLKVSGGQALVWLQECRDEEYEDTEVVRHLGSEVVRH